MMQVLLAEALTGFKPSAGVIAFPVAPGSGRSIFCASVSREKGNVFLALSFYKCSLNSLNGVMSGSIQGTTIGGY